MGVRTMRRPRNLENTLKAFQPKNIERTAGRMFVGLLIVQAVLFLASLALVGGIIYVAWHFIAKHW